MRMVWPTKAVQILPFRGYLVNEFATEGLQNAFLQSSEALFKGSGRFQLVDSSASQ